MIAMLARRIVLTLALAVLFMAALEQFNPAPPPMLVDLHRADFPVCVTVHNGRLRPAPPKIDGAPTSEID